jgi:hypothetical protein
MCDACRALGILESCPLPDFTTAPATGLLVENRQPPFGTPLHVIYLEYAADQPMYKAPWRTTTCAAAARA